MTSPAPSLPQIQLGGYLRPVLSAHGYASLVSQPRSAASNGRPWPLILFLHGTGERGSDVAAVARQGLPRLLSGNPELTPAEISLGNDVAERFVVVAPQCPTYEVWDESLLLDLLDRMERELNTDRARVYLTGLSMGGFGVWTLGLRQPRRFAALAPVCGGGRVADVAKAAREQRDILLSLGVWAFHGAKDRVVPLDESERMIHALREAGVTDVRFTAYPDREHDAWTPTYANPDLYAWLLTHHR